MITFDQERLTDEDIKLLEVIQLITDNAVSLSPLQRAATNNDFYYLRAKSNFSVGTEPEGDDDITVDMVMTLLSAVSVREIARCHYHVLVASVRY